MLSTSVLWGRFRWIRWIFTQIDFLSDVSRNIILQAAACTKVFCQMHEQLNSFNSALCKTVYRDPIACFLASAIASLVGSASLKHFALSVQSGCGEDWSTKCSYIEHQKCVSSHVQDCATFGNKVLAGSMLTSSDAI